MPEIGVPELLIVAVIVLLLFGPGKVADIGGQLGKGIREFRRASTEDTDSSAPPLVSASTQTVASVTSDASAAAATAGTGVAVAAEKFCTNCGTAVSSERFCTNCGTARA